MLMTPTFEPAVCERLSMLRRTVVPLTSSAPSGLAFPMPTLPRFSKNGRLVNNAGGAEFGQEVGGRSAIGSDAGAGRRRVGAGRLLALSTVGRRAILNAHAGGRCTGRESSTRRAEPVGSDVGRRGLAAQRFGIGSLERPPAALWAARP